MNKKIKIISMCATVVALSGICVLALSSSTNISSSDESSMAEIYILNSGSELKHIPEEDKEKQETTIEAICDEEQDRLDQLALEKKYAEVEKEEERLNQFDLEAYPILAKYYDSGYNRDSIIKDRNTEYAYLKKMVTLLKENKVTDNEKTVLMNYVGRRIWWLYDQDEETLNLKKEMKEVIGDYTTSYPKKP